MELLQFVRADDKGQYISLPNVKRRKIYFRYNGLSSPKYVSLLLNLIRQITQMDYAKHITPLIGKFSNHTVENISIKHSTLSYFN